MVLITTFFVTSGDSATFVLGMLTTGGKLNPPNDVKVVWGIILVASTLVLMASGGLTGLQTAIIVSALPLTLFILFIRFPMIHLDVIFFPKLLDQSIAHDKHELVESSPLL
ncbi:MAG: BCCT family transporter [Bacillota bacterium]